MCNVGNIILNSVLTFASVWIVRKFLDTFYEKKRWNVLSVSVWSIYIIFQVQADCFLTGPPIRVRAEDRSESAFELYPG